jgi:PAS domain S-box-containing protein
MYGFARAWERREAQTALGRLAYDRAEVLRNRALGSMEVLHSIASLYTLREDLTRQEFRAFCGPSLSRQPQVFALGWSPRVSKEDRVSYEEAARREGWPNFEFMELDSTGARVRAAERDEYFPVYYIEPPVRNGGALGFDVNSSPLRERTLQTVRDTGMAAATPPMHLVQEPGEAPGIVVYLPVYRGEPTSVDERRRALTGYVSAVFRIDDMVGSAVDDLAKTGYEVRVTDELAGGRTLFERRRRRSTDPDQLVGTSVFELAGLRWKIAITPPGGSGGGGGSSGAGGGQSRSILLTGLALTLALTAYLYSGLKRTEVIERRVLERTARMSAEVAERKRAEEAARVAELRYRGIFENATEGIFQTTPDGGYINANPALARMYGYESPGQLIADLADIAHRLYVDPSRRAAFVAAVQRAGSVTDFESQIYRRDGQVIWISENARAVTDESGRVIYYEGTVVDVTARKKTHEELEERVKERTRELALSNQALKAEVAVRKSAEGRAAAASEAKSRFLANMSHEIRTPMNAILGYAQILCRDRSLRDGQREAMATILSSGNHLLALIDDILDLSKIESGRVELNVVEFDLDRQVEELVAMFRYGCEEKGLRLELERAGSSECAAMVRGDQGKLRQVLINLLGNAVKFTERGWVKLRVERRGQDEVYFEVGDSGPGVPAESEEVVFEPFQQGAAGLRRGGTGLGLAISRQYVELMGGRLVLDSSPQLGSQFHFSLWLPASQTGLIEAGEGVRYCAEGVRALVVDDSPENRDVLVRMLRETGCDVETAADGAEALERAAARRPGVAFVDIMMSGVDGLETARRLVARHGAGAIRLVATTAFAFAHEHARYLEAGFDQIIAKPIRIDRVHQCLAGLQGVTIEADAPADADEPELSRPKIPADLLLRLAGAAELCSVTDLKAGVADLELSAAEYAPLARKLRRCIAAYDLTGVRKLLGVGVAAGAP